MKANEEPAAGSPEQLVQRGIAPVKSEYLVARRHAPRGNVEAVGGQAAMVTGKKSKKQMKKVGCCMPCPPSNLGTQPRLRS